MSCLIGLKNLVVEKFTYTSKLEITIIYDFIYAVRHAKSKFET